MLKQVVRLRRKDAMHSSVVAVTKMRHGSTMPPGYLTVPQNSPEVFVGTTYRHGNPPTQAIDKLPGDAVAVVGFEGLGDTVYMRSALKKLVDREKVVYLTTPWPQLFWDIPGVRPVKPPSALRTQGENAARVPASLWHTEPPGLRWYEYKYCYDQFRAGLTPISVFMSQFQVTDPINFSMNVNPAWASPRVLMLPHPIGVVHPPSVRREWHNISRNPKPEYLQQVISARADLNWVSVGWNKDGEEWYDGPPLLGVRHRFDHGELTITEILYLMSVAQLVLCGPSFPLPTAAALGTPVLCLFGGSTPPRSLIDTRMGKHVGFAAPEPFCACYGDVHNCNKTIEPSKIMNELGRLRVLR